MFFRDSLARGSLWNVDPGVDKFSKKMWTAHDFRDYSVSRFRVISMLSTEFAGTRITRENVFSRFKKSLKEQPKDEHAKTTQQQEI
jgi:hypothetical protein